MLLVQFALDILRGLVRLLYSQYGLTSSGDWSASSILSMD